MSHTHLYTCDRGGCTATMRTTRRSRIIDVDDWYTLWTPNTEMYFCGLTCLVKWAAGETTHGHGT